MTRPIVVTLDSSVSAGGGLPVARAVARQSGGSVHLVRVERPPEADDASSVHRGRELRASHLDDVGRYFLAELGARRVRTRVVDGNEVVDAVVAYARAEDAGLVVMAANGLEADGYARGMGAAAAVGRGSGVPVLLVHPEGDCSAHAGGRGFARVLVALSGTELDEELVEAIDALGGSGELHCTLVHVLPPEPAMGRAESAAVYLRSHASKLAARARTVETRVLESAEPSEAIAGIVRESEADLLVLGAHRRAEPKRAGFGSVTTALFRALMMPMLVVSHRS